MQEKSEKNKKKSHPAAAKVQLFSDICKSVEHFCAILLSVFVILHHRPRKNSPKKKIPKKNLHMSKKSSNFVPDFVN